MIIMTTYTYNMYIYIYTYTIIIITINNTNNETIVITVLIIIIIIIILLLSIIICRGQKTAHQKSTPQKSSWIPRWHLPMDVQLLYQRNFTCRWYFPKDCNFPSGLSLELSDGLSVTFSNGISPLYFLVCNSLPR